MEKKKVLIRFMQHIFLELIKYIQPLFYCIYYIINLIHKTDTEHL